MIPTQYKRRRLRYPASKWVKHRILQHNPELLEYLPDTRVFTRLHLYQMMDAYAILYVKPSVGSGGRRILKICTHAQGFLVRNGFRSRIFRTRLGVFRWIRKQVQAQGGRRQYLVQQGIDLLEREGKPMDFRVLLLRPKHEWIWMGIMGKVAGRNRYVTNHSRGGKPIQLEAALTYCTELQESERLELFRDELNQLSFRIANTLHEAFPRLDQLGLDIAIDKTGKLWVLEANTMPHYNLFRRHEDDSLFRHVRFMVRSIRKR